MPIDKTKLYQTFEKSLRRNERLSDLATRKALDLPLDDDMQIITNHTRQGLGTLGTLALGTFMLFSGGSAAAGLFAWMDLGQHPALTAPTQDVSPQDFKVTFWTEEGEPLEVDEYE